MMIQEDRQGNMQRRGFLGRMAAVLGLPLAWPTEVKSGSLQPRPQGRPQSHPQGSYHRVGQSSFSPTDLRSQSPWQHYPRLPILKSSRGNEPLFLEAIARDEVLYGSYQRWGDSTIRRISPIQLFQVDREEAAIDLIYEPGLPPRDSAKNPKAVQGWIEPDSPTYLLTWDHDREAPRTFLAGEFSPIFTAPWMHRYAPEYSKAEWERHLQRIEQQLRQLGIEPVSFNAYPPTQAKGSYR